MEWKPIKKEIIDMASGACGGRDKLSRRINRSKRQIGEYRSLERAPYDVAVRIEIIVKDATAQIKDNPNE